MKKTIPPLSLKKSEKSPSKSKNLISNQEYYPFSNDKSITTNESYTLLTEKNINIIKKEKNNNNINEVNNDNNNNIRYDKSNNNNFNHFKSANSLISNPNDIKFLKSIKNIKPSLSKNNYKINSVGPRFITLVSSINNAHKARNLQSPRSINTYSTTKLPSISKKQLLTEADMLVKERKKHDGLIAPHVPSNIKIKKSGEINLKNYVIKKIKEKQEEIRNNEKKLLEDFKNKQKIYDKKYKNFLNTVEENQKKEKEEENELNILKLEIQNKENIYMKEISENKKLVDRLKKLINNIISYKKYGSFIHKIFGLKFIYDEVGEFDGKDYYKMMYNLIDIYEKSLLDENFQKEEREFLELLLNNGDDLFLMQFSSMEDRVINQLDDRNDVNEQITDLNNEKIKEINALNIKKIESENDKIYYNNNRKQEIQMIKYFRGYDTDETERFLKYIIELGEMMGTVNKKKITNFDNIEESLFHCYDTLKGLEEIEYKINKYINEIDNIFNNADDKDVNIIEKIIGDRKKYNLKLKQFEIREIQQEEENKKKFKAIEDRKIIIKGRKVIQDFPLIKNNKKKKKVTIKKTNDDYEYLYYSSDEN